MLFGELCAILEEQPRWYRIRLESDRQEGWVDAKMITPMSAAEYKAHKAALPNAAMVVMPMAYAVSENNGLRTTDRRSL